MFWRKRKPSDFRAEIEAHLELETERLKEQGLSEEEACVAARRAFGNLVQAQERFYESSRWLWWDHRLQDLRFGLRMLSKNPGFTAVAVLTLALGIGANTAIFGITDAVLLRMLPVRNPKRLVLLRCPDPNGGYNSFRYPAFEYLRDHNGVLSDIFATSMPERLAVSVDGQAELLKGQIVSGGYYSTLGVTAALGRTITGEDNKLSEESSVALISYPYWKRKFDFSHSVLGKTITINGFPFTIIGVTPPKFFGLMYGYSPDITAPISMQSVLMGTGPPIADRNTWFVETIGGRLKPNVSLEQARANLDLVFQQFVALDNQKGELKIQLVPGSKGFSLIREHFAMPLVIIMAIVGLVLLVACANVANMLMARSIARQKEIALRLALGASRLRLVRQLLSESMILGILGGAAGLLFAVWVGHLLLALVASGNLPISFDFHLDPQILGFTGGVSVLVGILFGLIPVARSTRADLTVDLKATSGSLSRGQAGMRLGKTLIVLQVAVSMLLLTGAGLFVRSLRNLKDLNPGFETERVLLFSVEPNLVGYEGNRLRNLYTELLEHVQSIPGVRAVSSARFGELTGGSATRNISVPGYIPRPKDAPEIHINLVGPNFFQTMGMILARGRDFTLQDDDNAPKVAVINETAARRYFGDTDPVGRRIALSETPGEVEVIGIARDAKYRSLREDAVAMLFLPFLQVPSDSLQRMTYEVRTALNPGRMTAAIRQQVQRIDRNLPIFDVKTLAEQTNESLMPERLVATLSTLSGLLALVLACIGLYGVMAFAVERRRNEIGIRMALGARRQDVLGMVVGQGMGLTLVGMAIGLVFAFGAARVLSGVLFGVSPTDLVTFGGVSILLAAVALFACYIPARRATKVDPMVAVRYE